MKDVLDVIYLHKNEEDTQSIVYQWFLWFAASGFIYAAAFRCLPNFGRLETLPVQWEFEKISDRSLDIYLTVFTMFTLVSMESFAMISSNERIQAFDGEICRMCIKIDPIPFIDETEA